MLSYILPATNLLLIITISAVVFHNFSYLSKHRCCRNKLLNDVSKTYPLVKPEFCNQPLAQQTIENNHEIHELNKKYLAMEKRIETLEKRLNKKWMNHN